MIREAILLLAPHLSAVSADDWRVIETWVESAKFGGIADELIPLARVLLGAAIADVIASQAIPAWLAISHVHSIVDLGKAATTVFAHELRELLNLHPLN
jgi:hypothetical protein